MLSAVVAGGRWRVPGVAWWVAIGRWRVAGVADADPLLTGVVDAFVRGVEGA